MKPAARNALLAAALALAAAGLAAAESSAPEPRRIFFIGNSLTAWNDLPAILCRMAEATGRKLTCEAETHPNFALEDHWRKGKARRRIRREWDLVILQQGPSGLPESRENLLTWSDRWAKEIRARKGEPAVLMVWPSRRRAADFPRVSDSWRLTASKTPALLVPAGDAWRAAWKIDPTLPLYGPDGFHPSKAGSYLAALAIHRAVFGELPPVLTDPERAGRIAGGDLALGAAQLEALRKAALAAD